MITCHRRLWSPGNNLWAKTSKAHTVNHLDILNCNQSISKFLQNKGTELSDHYVSFHNKLMCIRSITTVFPICITTHMLVVIRKKPRHESMKAFIQSFIKAHVQK